MAGEIAELGAIHDSRDRVLLVGGHGSRREKLAGPLLKAGFHVLHANSSAQACQELERSTVAVVLLDLAEDARDLELLAQVKALAPPANVMVLAHNPTLDNVLACLRLGAFDYLGPVDPAVLVEKVKRAADAHAATLGRQKLTRKYEALFETVPGIVCFLTEDGVFRRVNREGARLLGYDADELVGAAYTTLAPDEANRDGKWTFLERRTGERATRRRVVELRGRNGERHFFEFCATGVYDKVLAGTVSMGTLGVGWDITEQTRLQEQLRHAQKMDAVGRLAGGIAHDFNNLLTVINSNARLLRGRLAGQEQLLELVVDVEAAGKRAADLTRQLLAFSRKQVHQARPLDLAVMVGELQPMLRRLLGETIDVVVALPGGLAPGALSVLGDRGQLEQVLVNLAINARDAMPHGGQIRIHLDLVEVTSDVTGHVPAGTNVRLVVEDTGTGLSTEAQEHLFEPFFTTKSPDRGTGLGLATVYGIIQQHHGTIEGSSPPGMGARFVIHLPRGQQPVSDDTRGSVTRNERSGGERVLLVEDEELVRKVMRRSLEMQGYRVVEAQDGVHAMELLAGGNLHMDLLVTDLVMPRMGGAQLAATLRAAHPQLPVLYVSGYSGGGNTAVPLLTSHAKLMEKPLTPGTFLAAVRALLDEPVAG